MDMRQYANAIASIESAGSGDYSAVGPQTAKGNRAYGRYQVMDFNVGPWTEKHFGTRLSPEEFLANPKAQEAVFSGEFGQYMQKYGNPQDAASMWFTGKPMSQGAGRSDILGTTGSGYVSKFNAALGVGGNMQPNNMTPMMDKEEDKTDFRDIAGNLAIAFNSLRHRPDPNVTAAVQNIRQQRTAEAAKNKTMEFLKRSGRDDLVGLFNSGVIDGKGAASIMLQDAESMRKKGELAATAEVLAKQFEAAGNSEAAAFIRANPNAGVVSNASQSLLSDVLGGEGFRVATPEEAAQYGAEAGQFDSDGRFYPTQKVEKSQVLTEAQGKATGFFDRARQSQKILSDVENEGTNLRNAITGVIPFGTYFQTPEGQMYEQAKRDFINAILRQESGAAIGKDEFRNADRQYFPQVGDTPQVIEQKRRNRETAIGALEVISGAGASMINAKSGQDDNGFSVTGTVD